MSIASETPLGSREVALFHSMLGVRPGVNAAADLILALCRRLDNQLLQTASADMPDRRRIAKAADHCPLTHTRTYYQRCTPPGIRRGAEANDRVIPGGFEIGELVDWEFTHEPGLPAPATSNGCTGPTPPILRTGRPHTHA
jgi:hypothetical protein